MHLYGLVLPLVFSGTAVKAINSCVDPENDDYRCQGGERLDLYACGLTEDDLEDMATCFDTAGRDSVVTLQLASNEFSTLPEDLLEGFGAVEFLGLWENGIDDLPVGIFRDLVQLQQLTITNNGMPTPGLTSLDVGLFSGLENLEILSLSGNSITTLDAGVFGDLKSLQRLDLGFNELVSLDAGVFDGLGSLNYLRLSSNYALSTLPSGIFDDLGQLETLDIGYLSLTSLPAGIFDELESVADLRISGNSLAIDADLFNGLTTVTDLWMNGMDLITLPAGLFDDLGSLEFLTLLSNEDLQCLPAIPECADCDLVIQLPDGVDVDGTCECPSEGACSECQSGEDGYTCDDTGSATCSNGVPGLDGSNDRGEVCCPAGCTKCGGSGCASIGLPDYDNFDCCIDRILSSAEDCNTTGEAPCIISGATTCSNGLPGLDGSNPDGDVCCPLGCTKCGGKGCAKTGLPDYDKFDCCVGHILSSGVDCDSAEAAPCVISS